MIFLTILAIVIGIAVFIGFAISNRLLKSGAANAAASGNTRDRVETADTADTRTAIQRWTQQHAYEQAGDGIALLRYQKNVGTGKGLPTYLDVRPENGTLVLESYVGMIHPLTQRPQPGEMPLSAPGMAMLLARKLAKTDHNRLRSELGLPAIG